MSVESDFWQLLSQQFAATSTLEWVGTISGFLCVFLAARQNIWSWPTAIVSVIAYSILFYDYQLYGDAALQLYFLGTSVYGWYYWIKGGSKGDTPVTSLRYNDLLKISLATLILVVLLSWFLDRFTDTNVPYVDAFCTAISFTAQILLTRKILQNWILWIIADVCYIPLYLYKNLGLTALLYALFLWLAVSGYLQWRKDYRINLQLKNT